MRFSPRKTPKRRVRARKHVRTRRRHLQRRPRLNALGFDVRQSMIAVRPHAEDVKIATTQPTAPAAKPVQSTRISQIHLSHPPKVINSYGTLDGPANLGPVKPTQPKPKPTQPKPTQPKPTPVKTSPASSYNNYTPSDNTPQQLQLNVSEIQTPLTSHYDNKVAKPKIPLHKYHKSHGAKGRYYEVTSQVHWDSNGRMDPKRGYGVYEHRIMKLTHYAKGHRFSMHFATLDGRPRGWVRRCHCKPIKNWSMAKMKAFNRKYGFEEWNKPFSDKNPIKNGKQNVHGSDEKFGYAGRGRRHHVSKRHIHRAKHVKHVSLHKRARKHAAKHVKSMTKNHRIYDSLPAASNAPVGEGLESPSEGLEML